MSSVPFHLPARKTKLLNIVKMCGYNKSVRQPRILKKTHLVDCDPVLDPVAESLEKQFGIRHKVLDYALCIGE